MQPFVRCQFQVCQVINLILIVMFADKRKEEFTEIVVPAIEESPKSFFKIVGDYTREGFAKNYGGHPRSDVALLNEQDDMTALQSVLARLQERGSDGVGADVPDSELALAHKSKYCQTASEMIKYYENLLEIRDNRELERLEGEEKEKRVKELADRRAALRATLTADEKEYLRKRARDNELEDLID